VQARQGIKSVCSGCHHAGNAHDNLNVRWFEVIPVRGIAMFLLDHMRRVYR